MEPKPKRIKGIAYPSSQHVTVRKREYIADPDGYYAMLGLDPNEKTWGTHEIKDAFRKIVKKKGHDPDLIKAYKVLTSPKRIEYDSLTKTINRLIEEISTGKRKVDVIDEPESIEKYAYYIDEGIEEDYELAKAWMNLVSMMYHRLNLEKPVRVVLSNQFKLQPYSWGELIYVDSKAKPEIERLAFNVLKDTSENWFMDYVKVIRKWDQ